MGPLATRQAARVPALGPVQVLTPTVRQHDKVVIALNPDRVPSNPFNPAEVSLDALITTPSGQQITVPGFWFQEYRRVLQNPAARANDRVEVLESVGRPGWRVHFSSGQTGRHRFVIELRDAAGVQRSAEQSFQVDPGPNPGVVRVSPRNPPVPGIRIGTAVLPGRVRTCACTSGRRERTTSTAFSGSYTPVGGNYVRLWQEYYVPRDPKVVAGAGDGDFTGFPLETQATGLGRYDLESAWRLDRVSDLCRELEIHWQLTFEMTVWWQRRMEYRWKRNPYNAENGGPCILPSDYFTSAAARELVRRRLRYSVARWGWSSNLVAWELWNEVDNNEGFDSEACADWHREMGDYLRSVDPWKHLITTSWRDRRTFALPQIDIVQGHSYFGPEYDAAQYAVQDTEHLMRGFAKPFFFGEQGIEGPVGVDPKGKHFHDLMWATVMDGAAGTGLYWWWHNYVDSYDLYHHYTALANLVKSVDWPAQIWKRTTLSRPNLPVSLNVYGLAAEDRAVVWIHDPLAFRIVDGKAVEGPAQRAASCNVVGLADGKYEVEWYDTSTGKMVRQDAGAVRHLTHFGYGLELKPPEFWGDIAARIIREGLRW